MKAWHCRTAEPRHLVTSICLQRDLRWVNDRESTAVRHRGGQKEALKYYFDKESSAVDWQLSFAEKVMLQVETTLTHWQFEQVVGKEPAGSQIAKKPNNGFTLCRNQCFLCPCGAAHLNMKDNLP